ncbi:hypothetical protein JMA_18860 [Jeotgalibacillus malaysiensis]|uniref:Uncharacterized protein n=1 Tax=Jeotgalibacillus malaysiensis TaxID=1508404 RepID=A0A0B5ARL8_9BACL|nr:hypothetical protein [Jeotgalibacillus malaysiensis]AJD91203.1 hypothetical protein JMA_18860 [Jeotgalibacillus malaysiensis]
MNQDDVKFRFEVLEVKEIDGGYRIKVDVKVRWLKEVVYHGPVHVDLNRIGIFPVPSDIASASPYKGVRGKLGAEIKQYIRIQRKFIPELVN